MKLVESILTKNPCYTAGRKIDVKGLMLHSVGCSQPRASAFINSWNSPTFDRACVHGFIDGNDGTVYQTLPWNHRGWHCGSSINGSGNNTHIGVEMCEPACITYTGGATFKCSDLATAKAVAERTYKAAVELFAMLCKEFHLDPLADGVVISHKEGHTRGIASNHGDPEHLWSQLGLPYTMDTFRKAVKSAMGGTEEKKNGTQAIVFAGLSEKDAVPIIGALCREDMKKSGVLASVSAAQFILESGYGKSELGQNANNMFGMKKSLDGYSGFLYLDKNGMPMVALHWEKYFQHVVEKYNGIYKIQMPKITPHVCRHTFCSNMAKSGMNPKTLQYIMGHSDIGVTLNTYTHLTFDDAKEEMERLTKAQ